MKNTEWEGRRIEMSVFEREGQNENEKSKVWR